MLFGLYEHIVVVSIIILILTRNTRFFYVSALLTLTIQLFLADYLRVREVLEKVPDCAKYSVRVFGKLLEICVSVKKENIE